jgi:protein-S-isoprenylcysteine O-methyltransferase Ste14
MLLVKALAGLVFLSLFLVSAFDRRHGWSHLPVAVSIVGDVLVASGLFAVFRVFRANSFTSATIEVGAGQRVVSTGPYALVRHPMYSGAFVMLAGTPLALGSWWAFAALPAMVLVIVVRLFDEERFLAANLAGYPKYMQRVRWRLVPGVF